MKKWWTLVAVLLIIIIVGLVLLLAIPAPTVKAPAPVVTSTPATTTPNPYASEVSVDNLTAGGKITSPVTVTGKAKGWYFEGSFPVKIKNAAGTVIAQAPAQAQSDWMSTGFVPFKVMLTFPAQPVGSTGTLVLMNDNPSGLPQNQKEVDIAVTF